MGIDDIVQQLSTYDGPLTLRPAPGDGTPEIAWGDLFFYFAPDGKVPSGQPFATIVTKNYPDEPAWRLDEEDSYRVNIAVGTQAFRELLGYGSDKAIGSTSDPSTPDTVMPHPTYGHLSWISVVAPSDRTADVVIEQLGAAYAAARERHDRRHS